MKKINVIGLGRVGLPFALQLEQAGFTVTGCDIDPKIASAFETKIMPFHEPGCQELLENSKIKVSTKPDPTSDVYVITVGTPLKNHIEADLGAIYKVIDTICENYTQDLTLINSIANYEKTPLIILRSTVAPNTTQNLAVRIREICGREVGKNIALAMCPERIAEGVAIEELKSLPQIIGTEDDLSRNLTNQLYSQLNIETINFNTYIEAELAKLFSNIYRYINFAIPNYFLYIADQFGVEDLHGLLDKMKYNYPRNKGLANPGFVAGACLRKDFGMINENFPQTDLILQAYKINEYMPKFWVDSVKDEITRKNVAILGYTFKKDTDDTRDSLSYKLIQYINRYSPKEILIHEPNLAQGEIINDKNNNYLFFTQKINTVLAKADIIFLAVNHSMYSESNFLEMLKNLQKNSNKIIVDIWNILK